LLIAVGAFVFVWAKNTSIFDLSHDAKMVAYSRGLSHYQTEDQAKKAKAYTEYLYGLLYEQNQNYPKAIEKFKLVKKFDPQSSLNRIHLGVSLARSGDKDAATVEFNEASRQNPDDPKVKMLTALIFTSQNQYEEAIRQFESVLALNPDNMMALTSLADLLVLSNRLPEAANVYEKIIEQKPGIFLSYFNLAIIESRLRRYDRAQANLEHAVRLNPESIKVRIALGLIHEAQLKYDDAILAFHEAAELNPIDMRLLHNLARLYFKTEDYENALKQYKAILVLKPTDVDASLDAAYLFLEKKMNREAIEVLDIPLNQGVNHYKLLFMKGFAVNRLGDFDESIRLYRDSLALNPNYADAHFYLGVLLDQKSERENARYHLAKAIELDPFNAQAYNYLGYMDIERGQNLDEAIQLIEHALRLDPQNAAYVDSLGWAYYKKGAYQHAVAALERAVELDKDDTIIRKHLADAYEKIGKDKEAANLLNSKEPVTEPTVNE
jgi:tetratricopeptide (TPR) repeat protein